MLRRMSDTPQPRPLTIERGYPTHAPGSVLITCGQTRVLCTASVSTDLPPFLIDPATGVPGSGWVTAEYAMLPGATPDRKRRGPDSRATEIKRLIGRSLRAAVDAAKMPGVCITCDCDVLKADGGTRTASITGAFVALADALRWAQHQELIDADPIRSPVAAISVGLVEDRVVLDLDYAHDSRAQVDLNVVMNAAGEFVEVQGTGETTTFTRAQLQAMLDAAAVGIARLIDAQNKALG
ncbi:MAG: ribonuclease PH [Planctomycetes bacterium]|jgi:ribonuclease PH|nr:ribonuclease PH [Planctomycetota bacterium]